MLTLSTRKILTGTLFAATILCGSSATLLSTSSPAAAQAFSHAPGAFSHAPGAYSYAPGATVTHMGTQPTGTVPVVQTAPTPHTTGALHFTQKLFVQKKIR